MSKTILFLQAWIICRCVPSIGRRPVLLSASQPSGDFHKSIPNQLLAKNNSLILRADFDAHLRYRYFDYFQAYATQVDGAALDHVMRRLLWFHFDQSRWRLVFADDAPLQDQGRHLGGNGCRRHFQWFQGFLELWAWLSRVARLFGLWLELLAR